MCGAGGGGVEGTRESFPTEGGKGKRCYKDMSPFWYVQQVRSELERLKVFPFVRVSLLGRVNSADRFPYLPKNSNIFILKNWLRK